MRLCIHFHTGQYHRNYIHTDYFCCKISLFLQKKERKKKKLAVSELKESMHFILACLYSLCMIHSQ